MPEVEASARRAPEGWVSSSPWTRYGNRLSSVSSSFLRPVLQRAAGSRHNPEIFTASGILLVFGAAWLTDWAGLSMAIGAFLGGLLLADSRYRHQVVADIQPFRGLLLGLFFMSVEQVYRLTGHRAFRLARCAI